MKCKNCKASLVINREEWECICGVRERDLDVIGDDYGCHKSKKEIEKIIKQREEGDGRLSANQGNTSDMQPCSSWVV